MSSPLTRRDLLKTTAATVSIGGALAFSGCAANRHSTGRATSLLGKRRLGKTDMQVGTLGFGGAEIGFSQTEPEQVDQLLNTALDLGLNAIDTAECYAESESLIASAIGHRRDEYYLFSKVGHWPERDGWAAAEIAQTIERSLTRLKTDYLDLVHLHSCSIDVLEQGEAIAALQRARDEGKLRYIGYSGDSKAALHAVRTDAFDTLMTSISFADQEAIDLTLPECRQRDMGVIVKRGIANAVWRYDSEPENGYHQEYWRRMVALDYDFTSPENRDSRAALDPESPAAVALRFALGLPGVHTSVVGTTNPTRYAQNLALLDAGPLPPERVAAIRARWRAVAPPEWVGQI